MGENDGHDSAQNIAIRYDTVPMLNRILLYTQVDLQSTDQD